MKDDFKNESQEKLVLIPLRVGVRKTDFKYYSDIRYFLKHYGSVGMLGGTPRHALYFCRKCKNARR